MNAVERGCTMAFVSWEEKRPGLLFDLEVTQ